MTPPTDDALHRAQTDIAVIKEQIAANRESHAETREQITSLRQSMTAQHKELAAKLDGYAENFAGRREHEDLKKDFRAFRNRMFSAIGVVVAALFGWWFQSRGGG